MMHLTPAAAVAAFTITTTAAVHLPHQRRGVGAQNNPFENLLEARSRERKGEMTCG